MNTSRQIEKWGLFEMAFDGPNEGNPFTDVQLAARFRYKNRILEAEGFYDGGGAYRVRFMPDEEGEWHYETRSNAAALNGIEGAFTCAEPAPGNRGPVRVRDICHFQYADGAPHFSTGTTCYAWNHQGDEMEEQTLATLKAAPFNKLRMCVFPKDYTYSKNEPEFHPFEGEGPESWDFTRFNIPFWKHLEKRIGNLRDLGIEADLILFHPYDRWGYSNMDAAADERYLRYTVARLAAYRNIWWSFANEFDIMPSKKEEDWDRFFRIVQTRDPAQHLRSIHNCRRFYDHGKPWVTHCSIQSSDLGKVRQWRETYRKPVVVDECCYEGDVPQGWGNISARELTHRFWTGFTLGGYVGHGETYLHPEDILWWSKGGVLRGESAPRIAFLRRIIEECPGPGFDPGAHPSWDFGLIWSGPSYALGYFGAAQPAHRNLKLPPERAYTAEVIDPWEMTLTPLPGTYSGECRVELPAKPYLGIRLRQAR